jgi:hypothetical protein
MANLSVSVIFLMRRIPAGHQLGSTRDLFFCVMTLTRYRPWQPRPATNDVAGPDRRLHGAVIIDDHDGGQCPKLALKPASRQGGLYLICVRLQAE